MTFKRSLDENLFWKETSDEWNCFAFYFWKIKKKKKNHRQLYCPININNNFLPSNRNKARTYSSLNTERFRIMFNVWRSVYKFGKLANDRCFYWCYLYTGTCMQENNRKRVTKKSPVSATITTRSQSLTTRRRGERHKPSRAKQTNARKPLITAPSSPNGVVAMLQWL